MSTTIRTCGYCDYQAVPTEKGMWYHVQRSHPGQPLKYTEETFEDEVKAMVEQPAAPTANLDAFLTAYESDDNIWWMIECGHHQNLFEAAIDRIEELTNALRAG